MKIINKIQQWLFIIAILLLGFFIQELPTSNVLQTVLPEWPYILILFFSVSLRFSFGLLAVFVTGLVQDVFLNTPLGLNALAYVASSFILIMFRLRFRHMNLTTQSVFIGLLVFLKVTLMVIFDSVFYSLPNHFWEYLSVPLSMLVWPLVFFFLLFFASPINDSDG